MPSLITDFPTDVRKAVLLKQAVLKADNKNRFKTSQKYVLIQIIREWQDLVQKFKPKE